MSDYIFHETFYRCITPVHVGCGQDVGIVDLPVIREKTTRYPYLPGSGIRGVLRDKVESKNPDLTKRLFGSDKRNEISAGCVSVLDARILLFSVRSAPGVFSWITCPFVLQRYADDHQYFLGASSSVAIPQAGPDEEHYLGSQTGRIYLEEYPFDRASGDWTWNAFPDPVIRRHPVVIIADSVFSHFVSNATIVTQHNRLTSAKTVEKGALFSVESLPPESVLYGFLGFTRERSNKNPVGAGEARNALRNNLVTDSSSNEVHFVLGGDESTGLGVTKMIWRE